MRALFTNDLEEATGPASNLYNIPYPTLLHFLSTGMSRKYPGPFLPSHEYCVSNHNHHLLSSSSLLESIMNFLQLVEAKLSNWDFNLPLLNCPD